MIIETKLYLPQSRSALVSRPQLSKRLDTGLKSKLTIVTAPAGYGKTTSVSAWAAGLRIPAAWVSLDAQDRDAIRFWRYTIMALKQAIPAFDDRAVLRFVAADPTGEALVASLLNQLHRCPAKVVLVWDDFHHIDELPLLQGIAYFLDHLPSNVYLYILGRSLPSLPLAKMRTEGFLNELEMEDLRFSKQETRNFFSSNKDFTLSTLELDAVLEQTEGWVAGMRLATLYLTSQENRERLLHGLGKYRNMADYFFEEVFRFQSEEMQHFLLCTSLLGRMNADLCQIMTGMNDCQVYLQQLEQTNCFLVSLDDQREWYRYHHLFQDFLRGKTRGSQLEHVQVRHLKVGEWLENHGDHEEALRHYIAGGHYLEAIKLLNKLLPALLRSELSTLRHWFAQIPNTLLFEHPKLLMAYIFSLFLLGDIESAREKLDESFHRWIDHQEDINADLASLHGGLMVLQLLQSLFAKDFEASIHYSEKYVRAYPEGDAFASLLSSLGTEGDFDFPDSSLLETVGNLKTRENIICRLIEIWEESSDYYLFTELNLGYGDIMYEWNRLEEARDYWQRAYQLGEIHQNRIMITVTTLMLAKGYAAEGRKDKANAILAEINERTDRQQYPGLYRFLNMYQIYLRLQWGETELACKLFEPTQLKVKDEIPSMMTLEYYIFACLLAEQGKGLEASELLWRLIHMARRTGRMGDEIRLLARQSVILAKEEQIVPSMNVLEEALALAESNGYLRTLLDAGKPFMELLQKYLEVRQKRHHRPSMKVSLPYVKRLLKFMHGGHGQVDSDLGSLNIRLTKQEQVILQLMEGELTNKEIANQLGVSISTIKTHINNIYGKFQVHNRLSALERAKALQLLD